MSYWLGIDVGTTSTAAAICRTEAGRRIGPDVVPLGTRSAAVSSVVYLGDDGQVIVGEAAERRVVAQPGRVVREFKRRIGDEVPMMIGGVPHAAPEIAAKVVRWVVDRVAEREGGAAEAITVTHPAGWGTYKIQLVAEALRAAGLPRVRFLTEPEAAAASYSTQERVEVGSTIAVYDLGGGTFDAAVVRKTGPATFSVLGVPEGIERLGGADFDDVVFEHVVVGVPALSELDQEAPATLSAIARLRRECTEAKEALSVDTEVTIPVLAPEVQSQVRLVRAEFEDMIRPLVTETVEALCRALRSAGVGAEDLDAVLLVGGSSRVPLVAQLVSTELGRPVSVDADPKAAIALGAALSAAAADTAGAPATAVTAVAHDGPPSEAVVPAVRSAGFDRPDLAFSAAPTRPSLTAVPLEVERAEDERRRVRSQRVKLGAAAGMLALVLAGGAAAVPFLLSRTGGVPADASTPAPPTTTSAAPAGGGGNGGAPAGHPGGTAPATVVDTPIKPATTPAPAPQSKPANAAGSVPPAGQGKNPPPPVTTQPTPPTTHPTTPPPTTPPPTTPPPTTPPPTTPPPTTPPPTTPPPTTPPSS